MEDKVICGLVGVAGTINKKEKDVFKFLLHLDIIRGPHSTGVASVKTNGDWDLVKKKGNAWDLFDSSDYSRLMTGTTYALIGHNRYATKGKVNNINAHPFEFEDVVGAHNGTIRAQWRLPDSAEFEVDSENIFYSIQNDGVEETLSKLDGAYALTYWDKRTDDLVLLRNNERTLYYCFSEDGLTLFWASEKWMLSVALSRSGIKYQDIEEVEECTIYRFNFERKFNSKEYITYYMNPFEEFVPPKKAVTSYTGNGGGSSTGQQYLPATTYTTYKVRPWQLIQKYADFIVNGEDVNVHGQKYISCSLLADTELEIRVYFKPGDADWNSMLALKEDTIFNGKILAYRQQEGFLTVQLDTIKEAEDLGDEEVTDSGARFPGYNGHPLTEEEFHQKAQSGCAWCTSPVTALDAKRVAWIDSNAFVCPDCVDFPEVKEYLQEM